MSMDPKRSKILIVDDNQENILILLEALGDIFVVVAACSGEKAITLAKATPHPDLILLDIDMPGMNGFEVCKRLKSDEKLKEIPVIFISALNETTDKIQAFSTGGVDYVTKPFQFEEVLARVSTHIRLRSMQHELEKHNLDLEGLIREKVQEISDSQRATIIALANLAASRDDDTGKHTYRTRTFCRILAEKLCDSPLYAKQIDQNFIASIHFSSVLHDIGKVGISDNILLKPGKLTPEEFEIMKTHTTIGAATLQVAYQNYPKNAILGMGVAIARSHHEKWDGSGYSDGLSGKAIPLSARIMALADVYDALRSKRPYKQPFTHEMSCQILLEGAGRHFDPTIVEAFKAVQSEFDEIIETTANEGKE